VIDHDPLVQVVLRVDLSHYVFGVVHLGELLSHRVREDLRDDVVSLALMVCVKVDELDAYLYLPSLPSPSRSLIVVLTSNLVLSNFEKYDIYY
jgi:hypothetical protein